MVSITVVLGRAIATLIGTNWPEMALRPIFIVITLVMLFLAWRKLYQPAPCTSDKVCADPGIQRRHRTVFWIVSAFILVLLVFPWFAPLLY